MAGNRPLVGKQKPSTNETLSTPKPPTLGLLTQTLVKSPVVRYIIPARIRHQKYNDVLLIYNNYVEIKEVVTQGYLPDLSVELRDIVKMDFDSPIRAARIFGSPRKITASVQEPTGIDLIVKKEQLPSRGDNDEYHVGVPPQALILSLESKKLVFLFAFQDASGAVHFLCSERVMPSQAEHNRQLGEYIAVDPRSRAMAVAAWEGSLTLYALKSMDQLKEELESGGKLLGGRFLPIKTERHLQVEGTILKMEFLHPQKGDDDHIVLVLIVSKDGTTALIWYDWDASKTDLPDIHMKPLRRRIAQAEQIPLLLIPLTMSSAFMLICETRITVYKGILTGSVEAYQQDTLEHMESPEEPGSSKRLPLWTQWARPMRGKEHKSNNQDDVYLCREDGVVRYLRIDDSLPQMIDSSYGAGILKVNIDTAFASIDLGVHHTDLLAVGGNLCNGGLWTFPPRKPPVQKVMIHNWTPLIDYTTAHNSHSISNALRLPGGTDTSPVNHSRIFACTGRGARHGAITEVRYGVEAAKLGSTIEIENIDEGGVLQIWALNDPSGAGTYLMLAHPTVTSLLFMNSDGTDFEEVEDNFGIDLDARTIAAGITAHGLLVQVTEKSISATSPGAHPPRFESHFHDKRILAASIQRVQGNESVLLTVVQDDQGCRLHHGYFAPDESRTVFKQLGESFLLPSEPSCISLQWIGGQLYAFIATTVGTIQVFCADLGSSFSPVYEYTFEGQFAVCDSIAIITLCTDSMHLPEHILVCGLRNGAMHTLYFQKLNSSDNGSLKLCETLNIGSTSVSVATDKKLASRAITICEHQMYTLEYPSKFSEKAPATLNKIYFTGHDLPGLQQNSMTPFTQTDPVDFDGSTAGAICVLAESQLYMARLEQKPHPIPRHLPVEGSPAKIIYSNYFKKLIALYIKTVITPPRQTNGHHIRAAQRSLRPVISFLDPNNDPIEHVPDDIDDRGARTLRECGPGEKVLGMMEWFPLEEDDKAYPLLVLNTLVKQHSHAASGRLLLFAIRQGVNGEVTLESKKGLDFESPVYTAAPYGRSSLIYCCGNDLVLRKLVMNASKRWSEPVKYAMKSPAAHISVHAHEVYVTTTKDSLLIFKIENGNIIFQFGDQIARNGLHHLDVPDHSLTLVSGMDCTVAGLWKPPRPRIDNSTCTVFQAVLPGSIMRFRCITRAGWYRESLPFSTSRGFAVTSSLPKSSFNTSKTHQDQSSKDPTAERGEAIIGASADGTLYQFDVIDEPSWRLLRYIQNMAMQDPTVCPFHDKFHRLNIEPSTSKKQHMQINGDILHRLLHQGGEALLGDMIDGGGEDGLQDMMDLDSRGEGEEADEDRVSGSQNASARRERFQELIADVAELADGKRDIAAVVQWMRFMLLRAL